MVVHGRPGFRLTQSGESGVGLNGAYLSNHSIIYLKYVLAKDKRYRDSRRALIRPTGGLWINRRTGFGWSYMADPVSDSRRAKNREWV